jgi:GNAT superfamily N-acetyltransferase
MPPTNRAATAVPSAIHWLVRPSRSSDRAFIMGLLPRLAQGFDLPPWRTPDEVVRTEGATLDRALDLGSEGTALLVAEDGAGTPGGFIYLERNVDYFRNAPQAHVSVLAVGAAAEGRGAGRALLASAEEWARKQGMSMLTLNVFDGNVRARRVYERGGFAPETLRYVKQL